MIVPPAMLAVPASSSVITTLGASVSTGLHRLGRRGVRVAGQVGGNASRNIDREVALEARIRRDHQGVDGGAVRPGGERRGLGATHHNHVGNGEAVDWLAEGEGVEDRPAGDVGRASLVIGDHNARRQRVDGLHRLGRRGVRVAGQVGGNASRNIDREVALEARIRRDHQGVDGGAVRPGGERRGLGATHHNHVGNGEAVDWLAEGEGVDDRPAGDVGRASLVIGDHNRRRQRVDRPAPTGAPRCSGCRPSRWQRQPQHRP